MEGESIAGHASRSQESGLYVQGLREGKGTSGRRPRRTRNGPRLSVWEKRRAQGKRQRGTSNIQKVQEDEGEGFSELEGICSGAHEPGSGRGDREMTATH